MNAGLRITVIVPVFNNEKYIAYCLDSLLEQTIPFGKIIVVDDGSSDDSVFICKKYAKENRNIYFCEIEHSKQGAARNHGLALSDSEYVMFVDSDDYIEKDAVEVLLNKLKDYEYDMLFYDGSVFYDGEIALPVSYCRSFGTIVGSMNGLSFFEYVYPRNYFASSCMNVFRRDFLIKNAIKYPEGYYFEDNYMTFVCMTKAQNVGYVKRNLYNRRVRALSTVTGRHTIEKYKDYLSIVQIIFNYIKTNINTITERLRQYVSDLFCDALKYGDSVETIDSEISDLLTDVWSLYTDICNENNGKVKDWNIGVLYRHWEIIVNIKKCGIDIPDLDIIRTQIENGLREKYRELLIALPLKQKDITVGIYGKGKHTVGLLKFYKHTIGEITSKIIYIETKSKIDNDEDTYSADKLESNCPSYIIISSFINRDQMLKELRERKIKAEIIDIYDNIYCDIFSNTDYKTF